MGREIVIICDLPALFSLITDLQLSGNPRQAFDDDQDIPFGLAIGFSFSQQQVIQAHLEILRHLNDQLQRSGAAASFNFTVMGITDPDLVAELFLC